MEKKGAVLIKPNALNHSANLSRLDGFYYKGTYYEKGIARKSLKIGEQTQLTFRRSV